MSIETRRQEIEEEESIRAQSRSDARASRLGTLFAWFLLVVLPVSGLIRGEFQWWIFLWLGVGLLAVYGLHHEELSS